MKKKNINMRAIFFFFKTNKRNINTIKSKKSPGENIICSITLRKNKKSHTIIIPQNKKRKRVSLKNNYN